MNNDDQHLKLLKIFKYILAGLSCFFSSFFLFHVYIGWSQLHGNGIFHEPAKNPPPPEFGWMFFIIGIIAVLCGWLFGAAIAYSGSLSEILCVSPSCRSMEHGNHTRNPQRADEGLSKA
jgi:uncharacterized membrane protein HdeD (DUF308 family)